MYYWKIFYITCLKPIIITFLITIACTHIMKMSINNVTHGLITKTVNYINTNTLRKNAPMLK